MSCSSWSPGRGGWPRSCRRTDSRLSRSSAVSVRLSRAQQDNSVGFGEHLRGIRPIEDRSAVHHHGGGAAQVDVCSRQVDVGFCERVRHPPVEEAIGCFAAEAAHHAAGQGGIDHGGEVLLAVAAAEQERVSLS